MGDFNEDGEFEDWENETDAASSGVGFTQPSTQRPAVLAGSDAVKPPTFYPEPAHESRRGVASKHGDDGDQYDCEGEFSYTGDFSVQSVPGGSPQRSPLPPPQALLQSQSHREPTSLILDLCPSIAESSVAEDEAEDEFPSPLSATVAQLPSSAADLSRRPSQSTRPELCEPASLEPESEYVIGAMDDASLEPHVHETLDTAVTDLDEANERLSVRSSLFALAQSVLSDTLANNAAATNSTITRSKEEESEDKDANHKMDQQQRPAAQWTVQPEQPRTPPSNNRARTPPARITPSHSRMQSHSATVHFVPMGEPVTRSSATNAMHAAQPSVKPTIEDEDEEKQRAATPDDRHPLQSPFRSIDTKPAAINTIKQLLPTTYHQSRTPPAVFEQKAEEKYSSSSSPHKPEFYSHTTALPWSFPLISSHNNTSDQLSAAVQFEPFESPALSSYSQTFGATPAFHSQFPTMQPTLMHLPAPLTLQLPLPAPMTVSVPVAVPPVAEVIVPPKPVKPEFSDAYQKSRLAFLTAVAKASQQLAETEKLVPSVSDRPVTGAVSESRMEELRRTAGRSHLDDYSDAHHSDDDVASDEYEHEAGRIHFRRPDTAASVASVRSTGAAVTADGVIAAMEELRRELQRDLE